MPKEVNVITEILIKAPIDTVAGFVANPDNAPKWYVNIKSVEWKTEKPLTTGSKIAFTAHFLGRKLSYIYEIVEFNANQNLVMKTAQGPFPMQTTYSWTKLDSNTTKMTLRNNGYPSGFSKLLAPLMRSAMKRANQKDLIKLKSILEGQ